jgi:hypothetical protein
LILFFSNSTIYLWLKNVLESAVRCAGTTPDIELSIPSSSPAPPGTMQNLDRSVRFVEELRSVIKQEWERVTLEEINEWINEMPRLMNEYANAEGGQLYSSC